MDLKTSGKMLSKIFFILCVFSVASGVKNETESKLVKSMSNALNVIVKEYYLKNNMTFDFVIFGENCTTFGQDIITNVMISNPGITGVGSIEMRLEKWNSTERIILKRSTIVFIESFGHYEWWYLRVGMANTDYMKFQHILVYKKQIKKFGFPHYIRRQTMFYDIFHYELSLYQTGQNLVLNGATFQTLPGQPFGIDLNIVNVFSLKNQKWQSNVFTQEQLRHFNGCALVFGGDERRQLNLAESYVFSMIQNLLESHLKFSSHINWGPGAYHVEFRISKMSSLDFIINFYETKYALVVSTGEEYSSYEKFYLPFDLLTWILCGIFFSGSFLVIFIIKLLKRPKIEKFVFGSKVHSPAFNVVAVFFGDSPNILPTRNFARYILMIFILYCLIIRTAYQSVHYDMIYTVSFIDFICMEISKCSQISRMFVENFQTMSKN